MAVDAFPPGLNDALAALQREVQRKLGRCMIRLQQYEGLMKAMVANMAVEGPPAQLQATLDRQVAAANTKTLGILVGTFTSDFLTPAVPEGMAEPNDAGDGQGFPDQVWFKTRYQVAMPQEGHEQARLGLAELVAMRNDLVHHFLDRFELWTENGCKAADAYLDACYSQIDGHFVTLRDWAKGMDEARASLAAFMQSPQGIDAIFHGIMPDGSVQWPSSTIVARLVYAERTCAREGWTLLDEAIAQIRATHPTHTPTRYGCKTWRQVLKQSGQFDLRMDTDPASGKGRTWYRTRMESVMVTSTE